MKSIKLITLLVITFISNSSASEFEKYKKLYTDSLAKIENIYSSATKGIKTRHLKSLKALVKKIQKTGDLDKTTVVMEALKSFEAKNTVISKSDAVAELNKLEKFYHKSIKTHDLSRAKKIVSLISRYDKGLEKMQKKFVIDGFLEEAKKVKTERQAPTEMLDQAKKILKKTVVVAKSKSKKLLKKENINLTDLKPIFVSVGYDEMRINGGSVPTVDGKECTDFIFAHADSVLRYEIPKGVKFFNAIGCSARSQSVEFSVHIDGKRVFKSRSLAKYSRRKVDIKVKIPSNAEIIELVIDDLGDNNSDHSSWAYPHFSYVK